MKKYFITLLLFLFSITAFANDNLDSLKINIEKYLETKNAEVGFAFYNFDTKEQLAINNEKQYPMQSVYKFHLALAVLDQVDKGKFELDQKILVKKSDLLPDTWSPLRDKYPNGNVELNLSELIKYTVAFSDNNGCDMLFRLIGGAEKVEKYIKDLGIKEISIKSTEEEMHKEWNVQFENWTTPLEAVCLLDKFFNKKILKKETFDFLWKTMVETQTGSNRIKSLIPRGTIVGHKTGSSGTNEKGVTAALNDIGIVKLPNNNHFAIAFFVSNSKENTETNEKIIAEITKMVWDYNQ